MRGPSFALLGVGAVALAAVALAVIGGPGDHRAAPAVSPTSAAAPEPSITAGGFTLTSASIALPEGAMSYPAGPHAEAMDANCTACHSPGMVLTQPALSPEQWRAEVSKMREVYKAPVPDGAVPDILAYLEAMPTQRTAR